MPSKFKSKKLGRSADLDDDDEEVTPRRRGEKSEKRGSSQGWGAVARRQTEMEERKSELENQCREFWLKPGESAVIQFLQDEPYCFDAHQVKDKRGNWQVVPCQLNTARHCTLCSQGVKQTWRAAFKLLDYRGNWDKDKKCFKNDEPHEKIWKVGTVIANALKQYVDKKGKDLSELVLEVTRSGSGKDSTYNFERAEGDDDAPMKPIRWKEKYPDCEELCQPPSDDEIDERGYETED